MKLNSNQSVGSQLKMIAETAISSSDNSKSGGGYMGLFRTSNGFLKPVKFLTHHSERGCHFDSTIIRNSKQDQDNKIFFTASEVLERTLINLAAKTSEAAKNEVQALFGSWRKKSACEGKTFLSRKVVFEAVKTINAKLERGERLELSKLDCKDSIKDTSLDSVRGNLNAVHEWTEAEANEDLGTVKEGGTRKQSEKLIGTKLLIKCLDPKFGGRGQEIDLQPQGYGGYSRGDYEITAPNLLSRRDCELLATICNATTLPGSKTKSGRGYVGLTLSNGELKPLKFMTHYSERGAKSDTSIMKKISGEAGGELAFKSSELLKKVLLRLARKAGVTEVVEEEFRKWEAKAAYNGRTLLSRDVVFNVAHFIAQEVYFEQADNPDRFYKNLEAQPEQENTRIDQLCALDARENLDTLGDLLGELGQ